MLYDKGAGSGSRVARELLRRCSSQLGPGIQKLLTNMMDGDGTDKDLDCTYGDILVQVGVSGAVQHARRNAPLWVVWQQKPSSCFATF